MEREPSARNATKTMVSDDSDPSIYVGTEWIHGDQNSDQTDMKSRKERQDAGVKILIRSHPWVLARVAAPQQCIDYYPLRDWKSYAPKHDTSNGISISSYLPHDWAIYETQHNDSIWLQSSPPRQAACGIVQPIVGRNRWRQLPPTNASESAAPMPSQIGPLPIILAREAQSPILWRCDKQRESSVVSCRSSLALSYCPESRASQDEGSCTFPAMSCAKRTGRYGC